MSLRQRTAIHRACDLCGCAALSIFLLAAAARSQGQPPPGAERATFRAGVETVAVSVTVRDRRSRLVTTLAREDFQLLVDGRPVDIEVFTNERRPLMLGILISTSRESGVARMRDVGRALVDALEPAEFAAVGTYALEIAISPFATSDRAVLHRVLIEEVWPGLVHTPVSPAVAAMIRALPRDRGKPVVVVAGSDYAQRCDYRPCLSEGDAGELALQEGVVVYGIINRTKEPPKQVGAFPVAKMSAATGGGYLFLTGKEDLGPLMTQVAEELRHEYLLGFTPPVADGREHSVQVEVARPGHRATARVAQKVRQ